MIKRMMDKVRDGVLPYTASFKRQFQRFHVISISSIANKLLLSNHVSMNMSFKILTLLADAITTTAPAAPMTDSLPSYEGAFVKMFLTLLVIVVGIIGTVWFLKRLARGRFGGSSSTSIVVLEKKQLSPKTILYVVEVEGKQVLIAESQLEIKKVMELEPVLEETEK
jgi:flagellar biogenesis protein FliO